MAKKARKVTASAANFTPTPWGERLQRAVVVSFHLMVFTVPFAFTWFNDELFEFNKMVLVYGFTVLIGGLWALRSIAERRFIWRGHWLFLPLLLFLLTQAVSTVLSIHPHTSLFGYYSRFHGGLMSSLSYSLLMAALVSNFNRRHLKPLLVTGLIAASGAALFAIPEKFGHAVSCLFISGSFTTDCWSEMTNPRFRIFGTFGQPNWLAAYLVTLLPVAAALAGSLGVSLGSRRLPLDKPTATQAIAVTALGLMTIALLLTESRSGLLGLAAGMAVWAGLVAVIIKKRWQQTWRLVAPAGLMMAVLIALLGSPFNRSLPALVGLTSSGSSPTAEAETAPQPLNRLELGGTDSGEIRRIVWSGALDVWKRYPLFGSGVETFAYSYYRDRPVEHNLVSEWNFLYNKAHNELLNLMATTGTVGTAAYLGLLTGFGWLGWRLVTGRGKRAGGQLAEADRWLVAALLGGVAALSVSNFFGFSTVTVSLLMFLYFGMLAVWALGDHPLNAGLAEERSVVVASRGGSWRQVMFSLITVLIMAALWQRLVTFWTADRVYAQAKAQLRLGAVEASLTSFAIAIDSSPQEALYYDRLASALAGFAKALAEQNQASSAAEVARFAVENSNTALELNPAHLNFYKSRADVFLNLAAVDPQFAQQAVTTLQTARQLSPTDPTLPFNLGLAYLRQDQLDQGIAQLELAVELKSDYEAARVQLGQAYEARAAAGRPDDGGSDDDRRRALEQYRYILENLKSDHQLAQQRAASLSGTIGP